MTRSDMKQIFTDEESTKILVKLNSASQKELQEYPAVTKAMANTIVAERDVEPLSSIAQLHSLRGLVIQ